MNLPVAVIVGRPNVGKSTLFNILTKSRQAIVADTPGVTRDRHYSQTTINDQPWIIVDTGGFTQSTQDPLQKMLNDQVRLALNEADTILWLLDAKTGLLPEDIEMAKTLRHYKAEKILCVNKSESLDYTQATQDFFQTGFTNIQPISCAHKQGIQNLQDIISQSYNHPEQIIIEPDNGIKLAVIGRPNVGKSTFINALLRDERMLVSDISGTTRDSIHSNLTYKQDNYVIIDTAGVRKKSKIKKYDTEGFSVVRSLKSVDTAHVVVVMFDISEGITDQDCQLLRYVKDSGKGLVLVFNKSDLIDDSNQFKVNYSIDTRLNFINFADRHYCSAINKKGINPIMKSVKVAYINSQKTFSTSELTKWLEQAQKNHAPPMINSRRIKLRFAHMSKGKPPYIVIHGKQTASLPVHYKQYLQNSFIKYFNIKNIPIRMTFKTDTNPYVD